MNNITWGKQKETINKEPLIIQTDYGTMNFNTADEVPEYFDRFTVKQIGTIGTNLYIILKA